MGHPPTALHIRGQGRTPGIASRDSRQHEVAPGTKTERDPFCNPTNGIDRVDGSGLPVYLTGGVNYEGNPDRGTSPQQLMDFVKWDPYRYYNIWVVTNINSRDPAGVAAFAYYPTNPLQDGVIIRAGYLAPGNFVLPHELGHAFFLYHVFEGSVNGSCPVDNDCNLDGDRVCDTDPVTVASAGHLTDINPCNNKPYSDNTEKNFMNYAGDAHLFTAGQRDRMQQTLFNNILRDTLTKSTARFAADAAPACSFVLQLNGTLTQNDVFLNWKETGLNTSDYQLQRSYNGINFSSIGFIAYNAGNNQYGFHDPEISQPRNFYRLMQVLPNGKEIVSNTVIINNPVVAYNQFLLLNNPVNNYIDMQFGILDPANDNTSAQSNVEIRLLDISGKLIRRYSATADQLQRLRISVSDISAGIYILQVLRNNTLYVKKVLKTQSHLF